MTKRTLGKRASSIAPKIPLLDNFVEVSESELASVTANGLHQQAGIDLHALGVVCRVCEHVDFDDKPMTEGSGVVCKVLPRQLRLQVVDVVKKQAVVSSRLKSVLKVVYGAQQQLGKKIWDRMLAVAASFNDQMTCTPQMLLELLNNVKMLEDVAAEGDWLGMCDALAEVFEDHGTTLAEIGDAFSGPPDDEVDDVEMDELVNMVVPNVCCALISVLGGAPEILEFVQAMCHNDFHCSTTMADLLAHADEEKVDMNEEEPNPIKACIIMANWFNVIHHFYLGPELQKVLAALKPRVWMCVTLWNLWWDFVKAGDIWVLVEAFTNLGKDFKKVRHLHIDAKKDDDSSWDDLHGFVVSLAKAQRLEELICSVFCDMLTNPKQAKVALAACVSVHCDMLPKPSAVVTGALVLQRLQDAHTRIDAGTQSGGVLELGTLLHEVQTTKHTQPQLCGRSPNLESHYKSAVEEWHDQVRALVAKVQDAEIQAHAFKKRFDPVVDAITIWDFKAVPFVMEKTSPEDSAMAKKIELIVAQLPMWSTILERLERQLACVTANCHWSEKAVEKDLNDVVVKLPDLQQLVDGAARTLGAVMVVSMVLQSESFDSVGVKAALSFCQTKLKVSTTGLPKPLQDRIKAGGDGVSTSASSTSDKKKMQEDSQPASSSSAPGAVPRKRMKRT